MRAFSVVKCQLERLLQSCNEASIHRFKFFSAPLSVTLIGGVMQGEGERGESHGGAAWRSGADKSITPDLRSFYFSQFFIHLCFVRQASIASHPLQRAISRRSIVFSVYPASLITSCEAKKMTHSLPVV